MMEHKHLILSTLSAGLGLGLGLGLGMYVVRLIGAKNSAPAKGISRKHIETELLKLVVDGRKIKHTLTSFPYYLSQMNKDFLIDAAGIHLKHSDVSKDAPNLSTGSRTILLSGQSEKYHQKIAGALAHYFEAKLLILDANRFSLELQSKYGITKKRHSLKRSSILEVALEWISCLLHRVGSRGASLSKTSEVPNINGMSSTSSSGSSSESANSWCFEEKAFLDSVYNVLVSLSQHSSMILHIRDVNRSFLQSSRLYESFDQMLKKLKGSILVVGSRNFEDPVEVDERLNSLFPCRIDFSPPENETQLKRWKSSFENDVKKIQYKNDMNHIVGVLLANSISCPDLFSISQADMMVLRKHIEEMAIFALSHHLTKKKKPKYSNGKLIISHQSLLESLTFFRGGETDEKDAIKTDVEDGEGSGESKKGRGKYDEIFAQDKYDEVILSESIDPKDIEVKFSDIGALDEIKESLRELVFLPLQRPDLFNGLLRPCSGILLFGPPGTGKTMLAKAIASECNASFIHVSISTFVCEWFGEGEKTVRALFKMAGVMSPTIIFVDEVDSLFIKRSSTEHEFMRRIKNEFMSRWDGFMTKRDERILVVGATNRPFDLDDAILRRFERRIMVDMPSMETREMILAKLLSNVKVENLDLKELASMTQGYCGSDLKNLCVTAAYRPVRDLMRQERIKEKEKLDEKKGEENAGKISEDASAVIKEEKDTISLRPLTMEDLKYAQKKIGASFASTGSGMEELKRWNEMYGDGGSRKIENEQLSYFV